MARAAFSLCMAGGAHDYGERRRGQHDGGGRSGGSAWHKQGVHGSSTTVEKTSQPPLLAAIKGVAEANGPTEWALRCACVTLEHQKVELEEADRTLSRIVEWLIPPVSPQVLSLVVSSGLPGAIVRTIRKYRNEPPVSALACIACSRAAGGNESASAHVRAGVLEEVGSLMDRHPAHGGVQNVGLLLLCASMKDASAARRAVSLGFVARVVRALEATDGREVQYNGLGALRLLVDNGRAPRVGLQDVSMRAKTTHQNDTDVCAVADDILAMVIPRFKEMMCWHWQSGWCKLGSRCTYAHGPAEFRGGSDGKDVESIVRG